MNTILLPGLTLLALNLTLGCTRSSSVQSRSEKETTAASPSASTDATSNQPAADASKSAPAKTDPSTPTAVEAGDLNVQWIHGAANCAQTQDPPLQVHPYNKNFTIFRQSKCLNFEGPFIYLIFGAQKALLLDTGATASATTFPLRQMVEAQLTDHYGAAQRAQIQLIVAHSHAHGDHRSADPQFAGQAATTVVGTSQAQVASFFAITSWPEQIVDYDLGGRVLKVIPIPGHEASHIAIYDAQTGLLLSGDTFYPGRLYIDDWEAFRASVSRLVKFTEGRTITQVMGAHIEMTKTAGTDYPTGSTFQPDEHILPLSREKLVLLDSELKKIGTTPTQKVLDDVIISP